MYKRVNIKTAGQEGSANTWITIFLIVIALHLIVILSVAGFKLLKGGNEIPQPKEVKVSGEQKPQTNDPPLNLPPEGTNSPEPDLSSQLENKIPIGTDGVNDKTVLPPADVDINGLLASLDSSPENTETPETSAVDQSVPENLSTQVKTAGSPEISGNYYIVVEGDTLGKIASKTGVSIDEIRKKNRLDKDVVKIDQKLTIPGKSNDKPLLATVNSQVSRKQPVNTVAVSSKPSAVSAGDYKLYRVGKGDTLNKIATLFRTSPENLAKINGIGDPRKLKAGTEIKVPKE
ncbi:MAG: LysM peptidoglycan-binding domain-containing protein [Lentisphaerae bacterium]|nr:LysM peptidoglycan-binding domain-containing protein [Lentisphaerota bacterium]